MLTVTPHAPNLWPTGDAHTPINLGCAPLGRELRELKVVVVRLHVLVDRLKPDAPYSLAPPRHHLAAATIARTAGAAEAKESERKRSAREHGNQERSNSRENYISSFDTRRARREHAVNALEGGGEEAARRCGGHNESIGVALCAMARVREGSNRRVSPH